MLESIQSGGRLVKRKHTLRPRNDIAGPVAVDLRTCGPVDLWTRRACGLMGIWSCGPVDLCTYGPVNLWVYGPVGLASLWTCGPVALWTYELMDLRTCRAAQGLRVYGTVDR